MMASWYQTVKDDPTKLTAALAHFTEKVEEANQQLDIEQGQPLIDVSRQLPSLMAYYFTLLQEIDAILLHYENIYDHERAKSVLNFVKTSKIAITFPQADKIIDADQHLFELAQLKVDIKLVRDKFTTNVKCFEALGYQVGNITRLRVGGIIDATF